jgi:Family of unknown function (DUF6350)
VSSRESAGRGASQDGGPPPSATLAVVGAALSAALTGLAVVAAVVLVAWMADSRSGTSAERAVRAAADAWLLGHRGSLRLASGTVTAAPLGLTALAAVMLHRAGASVGRTVAPTTLAAAARATAGLAAGYAVIAASVARVAATPEASVPMLPAALGAAVLAAVAGGTGLLRSADLVPTLAAALPAAVPVVARAAGAAVAVLVGAGAAVVAGSLAGHASQAIELSRALDPGLVGGLVLLLASLLAVPNAAIWGAGYIAGPGFAVGVGTGVSPFGVALGPVPALPLLAGLPADAHPPEAVRALLMVPLIAGALAGVLVARRLPAADSRLGRCAACAFAAGAAVGLGMAVLAALAGGSVGGGYLAAVGPSAWQVGLAVAVEVAVPAALTAVLVPPATAPESADLDVMPVDTPTTRRATSRSAESPSSDAGPPDGIPGRDGVRG